MQIDGIYAGYMTGAGGSGVAMFVIRKGTIVGADMGGVLFDGSYSETADGSFAGTVAVQVPAGVTVIQGVTAPPAGLKYEVPLTMPANFLAEPFFLISTPLGKVNARLQKLRDL